LKNRDLLVKIFASLLAAVTIIISSMGINTLILIIGYPILAFIVSLALQLVVKKKAIVLSILAMSYSIVVFIILAPYSMMILPIFFVYIIIGLIGTFVADLILKRRKKFIK
jgi:hypothetical protein